MSFDVFLAAFRNGDTTTADAAAARAVLERFRYHHQLEFNAYDISFADGSSVELFADSLDDVAGFHGGMFALRGFSDAIGSFIFDYARAARCVIIPAMEPPCVLLPRDDLAVHLPEALRHDVQHIRIESGGELIAALSGGFDSWRAYRDQMLPKQHADRPSGTDR